jgi:predicted MFS family arabinose efflux permease
VTPALCSCGIAVALMHTLVVPLLPHFPGLLGVSPAAVSWLVTSTMLAGAISAPVFGRLGDLFGRRRILLFVLGLMLAGSVLGAVSWSYPSLIIARSLQGAAFGVIPLGISLLKDTLPADRAGSGVATMSSTLGAGGAIGLPLAGFLATFADWHVLFWVAGAVSLIAMALAGLFVPESSVRASGRFDVLGAIGLSAALLCLLLGVSQCAVWGWTSGWTWGAFAVSGGLLAVWAVHELRATAPLVNLRAAAKPMVLLTNVAAVLVGVAMFTSFVLIGQLLQAPESTGYGHGVSTLVAGLCMAPTGIAMLIFAPLSARLSAARGAPTTLLAGCVVLAIANLLQAMLLASVPAVIAVVTLTATGTALTLAAMPTLIMAETPETETAAANSLNAVMRTIGISTCSAGTGALLVAFTVSVDGRVLPSGTAYTAAFAIASGCAALAAVASCALVVLRRRRLARRSPYGARAADAVAYATT